jgi:hypothetical protein
MGTFIVRHGRGRVALSLVIVVVGLLVGIVASATAPGPSNASSPPPRLVGAINALGSVPEPPLLTPVTGQGWYSQALGHANQVNAQFFAWRRSLLGTRSGLSSIPIGSPLAKLLAAMSLWIGDMRFESRARDWCFMTFPYNGGSGTKPVACWNAEVASHRTSWLRDAQLLQVAAARLGIHLILPVAVAAFPQVLGTGWSWSSGRVTITYPIPVIQAPGDTRAMQGCLDRWLVVAGPRQQKRWAETDSGPSYAQLIQYTGQARFRSVARLRHLLDAQVPGCSQDLSGPPRSARWFPSLQSGDGCEGESGMKAVRAPNLGISGVIQAFAEAFSSGHPGGSTCFTRLYGQTYSFVFVTGTMSLSMQADIARRALTLV